MSAIERSMLEGICAYVDEQKKAGTELSTKDVLERFAINELDGPALPKYFAFTQKYLTLTEEYHHKREQLISPTGKISLDRVITNSLAGGLAGSVVSFKPIGSIVGATAGCALTLYDEAKRFGLNFSDSFFGVVAGGFVGAMVYKPLGIAGAAIGGCIGLYNTAKDAHIRYKEQKKKTQAELRILEDETQAAKMALYQQILPTLLESKNIDTVPTLDTMVEYNTISKKTE